MQCKKSKNNLKGSFKSEDTGKILHLQHKYSKSLSLEENLNFPSETINNLFKFSAHDSDLEYLCWRHKNFLASSDWFFAVKGQKISDDFFYYLEILKKIIFFYKFLP